MGAWSRKSRLWVLVGSPLAVLVAARGARLRFNLTASLPVGLYVETPGPPTRGALVLICLPHQVAVFARARGYLPRGGPCPGGTVPIGKFVVARAGDTVTITPHGLLVNGTAVANSAPQRRDRHGRPLEPVSDGRHLVPPDSLWVVAFSPWSFDSRYFGPLALSAVRARLRPLWTR